MESGTQLKTVYICSVHTKDHTKWSEILFEGVFSITNLEPSFLQVLSYLVDYLAKLGFWFRSKNISAFNSRPNPKLNET